MSIFRTDELSKLHRRADRIFQIYGSTAPSPSVYDTSYRRRLGRLVQSVAPKYKDVRLDSLGEDAYRALEPAIYADAEQHAQESARRKGKLIPIESINASGHHQIDYVGDPAAFIKMFSQPANYITGEPGR